VGMLIWKRCKNRRYYAAVRFDQIALDVSSQKSEASSAASSRISWLSKSKPLPPRKPSARLPPFSPLPSLFVFPNLPALVASLLITGLVQKSIAVLVVASDEGSSCAAYHCTWVATATLALAVLLLSIVLTQLVHFYARHAHTWEPIDAPDDANSIEDPGYRWASKLRSCCCTREVALLERDRGAFEKPESESREPARTERLLRAPIRLVRPVAADAQDALALMWLAKASGGSFFGVSFVYVTLIVQLCIGALAAIGPSLTPGSVHATMQVVATLVLQLGTSAIVLGLGPAADRVENLTVGLQFGLEGCATAALLVASRLDLEPAAMEALQLAGFFLALAALFLPILQKLYDAVVAQLSRLCRKDDGCSPTSACFAVWALAISIPGLVVRLLGWNMDTSQLEGAADEAASAMELAVEEAAATGLNNLAWLTRPTPEHHDAAKRIQRRFLSSRQCSRRRGSVRATWEATLSASRAQVQPHASQEGLRSVPNVGDSTPVPVQPPPSRASAKAWLDNAVKLIKSASSGSSVGASPKRAPSVQSQVRFARLLPSNPVADGSCQSFTGAKGLSAAMPWDSQV